MRKIKCYCDVCGRETKADDLMIFKANDFYSTFIRGIGFKKWEICKDCVNEIGERIRESQKDKI